MRNSIPYIRIAGLNYGDDGWDEFEEMSFETLVSIPVFDKYELRLNWTYGHEENCMVNVKIDPSCSEVFLGKKDSSAEITSYKYEKVETVNSMLQDSSFIHLFDPFEESNLTGQKFNYIKSLLPDGNLLRIPLENCEFKIK